MKKQFAQRFVTQAVKAAMLSSLVTIAPSALADNEDAKVDEETSKIEHIEVTSRRRTESLNKIPVSVVSFDTEEMQKAGMQSINDLANGAIGLSMEKTFGRQGDIPVMRGVSWIPGFGSPKASVFIDGIYYAGSIQSLPLDLIERVEVIKGPQSALYGRRTFSGAINLVTQRPNDVFSAYVNGTLGQNGNQQLGVGVNAMLTDELAIRGSFSTESYDGDWENEKEGGPEVGGESSDTTMIGIYYTPTENTDISFNYIKNEFDDEHSVFIFQGGDQNNCYLDTRAYYCGEVNVDNSISLGGILENDEYGLRGTREHMSFKVDHTFDLGTLSYMYGSNKYESENGVDQTYAGMEQVFSFGFFYGGPFLTDGSGWHTLGQGESEEDSHEIRFSSSALNEKLLWSVAYYMWHAEEIPEDADSFADEEDNSALMGSISYEFSDQFTLSAEVRMATDEINTEAYDNLIKTPGFENVSNEFDSTTTRFIGEYHYDDDTMFYLTRSEGNSPGGFNTDPVLPASYVPIDEEDMVMYEGGVKATMLDGELYVAASVYTMDWDNQQLTDTYFPDGAEIPTSYVSNAGETEVNGFEIQGKYVLTDDINLDFGYSMTDAKFVEFFDSNHCRIISGLSSSACNLEENLKTFGDVSGNTPPQVPKDEVSLAINYSTEIADEIDLFARADINYDSSRYAHVHNFAETGARTLVNLNVGVEGSDWRVSAWVKNLTEDETPTYVFRYIDAQSMAYSSRAFPIAPSRGREVGISFRYMFEAL